MGTMTPKLLSVPLACDADHAPKVPLAPSLHSRDSILDDHTACRICSEQLRCHQERIWCGLPGQVLLTDRVAVDAHLEEVLQLGGFEDGVAVLTCGDDGNFESLLTELTDELDSPRIRFHPHRGDDVVDEVILAVPEPTHRVSLWGVIRGALREVDATGGEKVAHAVEVEQD